MREELNTRETGSQPASNEVVRVPWWEWAIAGLGAAFIAAILGYTAYRGLTERRSPPAVVVAVQSIIAQEQGYLVSVRVSNRGGSTAAGLRIRGVLRRGQNVVEASEITFDYVPARSHREGGLFFREDPRAGELKLRAIGYAEP